MTEFGHCLFIHLFILSTNTLIFLNLFIFGCAESLCFLFSSYGKQGLLSSCFSCFSQQALAGGLRHYGPGVSRATAHGIFADQGSNLHWQADSLPLTDAPGKPSTNTSASVHLESELYSAAQSQKLTGVTVSGCRGAV